jgi:uncharacterized iron-regulated protein
LARCARAWKPRPAKCTISSPDPSVLIRTGAAATLAALIVSGAWAEQIDQDAVQALPPAQIVILGEVHDNPEHHLAQALAVMALRPAAVAFEMLDPDQADLVNTIGATAPDLAARLDWADSGWPDFALYQPVFAALGAARVYGMALPRGEVRRAVSEGAAAVMGAPAARFGLDRSLPEAEQTEREADQMRAHCDALPEAMLPGMVAAQRLRDAHFAKVALQALEDTGGPVAVITGSGHARTDWGMPAALRIAAPEVSVLSVGQLEAAEGRVAEAAFDLWLVTPPTARPDPCAGFAVAQ